MNSFEDFNSFAATAGIQVSDLTTATMGAMAQTDPIGGVAPAIHPAQGITAQGKGKLAILLHGFNPSGSFPYTQEQANQGHYNDYQEYFDALCQRLPGYAISVPVYDTHQSFAAGGDKLHQFYMTLADRFDLSQTVIVAYSMGGLVARKMVANGLPFAKLYTNCTPHLGVMPYLFTIPGNQFFFPGNRGATSMVGTSQDLWRLNDADRHLHGRYHCHGICYTDVRGYHGDDCITELLGSTMAHGAVAARSVAHIGMLQGKLFEPHLRGYQGTMEWFSDRWAAMEFIKQVHGT